MINLKPPVNVGLNPVPVSNEPITIDRNGVARLARNPVGISSVIINNSAYAAVPLGSPVVGQYLIAIYTPSSGPDINLPLLQFHPDDAGKSGTVTYSGGGTSITAEFFTDLVSYMRPLKVNSINDLPNPLAATDVFTRGGNGDMAIVGVAAPYKIYGSDGATWSLLGGWSVDSGDVSAPAVTAFTATLNSVDSMIADIYFLASDDVGVVGYLITEDATPPTVLTNGWVGAIPSSYHAGSAGSKTLYPWARDAIGNVSPVFEAPRTVLFYSPDTTAPVVTSFSAGTVTGQRVPVTIGGTDATGVTGWCIKDVAHSASAPSIPAPSAFTAVISATTAAISATYTSANIGSRDMYVFLRDAAGNVSNAYGPVNVTFEQEYTIVVVQPSYGTITPSGILTYTAGSNAIFTITPTTGYRIDSLTIDGSVVADTTGSYTFSNISANHTIGTTISAIIPGVPTLDISTVSEASITLSWSSASGATHYQVQYAEAGTSFAVPVDLTTNEATTSFTWSSSDPALAYDFRVRAINVAVSDWSTTVTLDIQTFDMATWGFYAYTNAVWATARNATSGANAYSGGTTYEARNTSAYLINRAWFNFDTAALPDAAITKEAKLYHRANLVSGNGQVHVLVSTTLTSDTSVVGVTGYDKANFGFVSAGTFPQNPGTTNTVSTTVDQSIIPINTTGYTNMGLIGNNDLTNSAPTNATDRVVWNTPLAAPGARPYLTVRYKV